MANDRMTFTLVGRDDLSRVLRRAGRAARDMDRDINESSANSSNAVERFTRDANGRLRDSRGRFISAGEAARLMAADVDAGTSQASDALSGFTRDARGRLRDARGRFVSAGVAARAMGDDVARGASTASHEVQNLEQTTRRRLNAIRDRFSAIGTAARVGLGALAGAARGAEGATSHLVAKLVSAGVAMAIPAAEVGAAVLLKFAASAGAAVVAIGALGLAVIPQVKSISALTNAQGKYNQAVGKYGPYSKQALQAQEALAAATEKMPPATLKSAAALTVLQKSFKKWSDSVAGSTMPVVTDSFMTLSKLLPHLAPLARNAGTEMDKFIRMLAGGMNTKGFDRLVKKFTAFSTKTLQDMNAGFAHFVGWASNFKGTGFKNFMAKAAEYGPIVGKTFRDLGTALGKILSAGGDVGIILLHVADNLLRIVNAIPTGALSTLLQFYTTFKLISLGAAGLAAAAGLVGKFTTAITAMAARSAAATGALASIRAGFVALSTTAKLNIVIAGIAALVLVMTKLSDIGKRPAANVDRLTSSLKELGRTGRVTGEAAKAFGKDLSGLADSLRLLARPSISQHIDEWVGSLVGIDTKNVSKAKKDFDAVDTSLSDMVKSGNADLAAAAVKYLSAQVSDASKKNGKGALSVKEFKAQLDDYRQSLKDSKLAQKLAADSMGLFGDAAVSTQQKLAAQKKTADGLLLSIEALNDAHRAALGGMIGFEQAIDDTAKVAKKDAGSLKMVNGHLDLNSQKSRDAASALSNLADKTKTAAASALKAGQGWGRASEIYARGREQITKFGEKLGLTGDKLKKFVDYYANMPDKTVMFKGNLKDLKAKITSATKDIHNAPASKLTKLQGNISDLEQKLAAAKKGIKDVPASKRSHIRGEISDLEKKLAAAHRALNALVDKTVTVTTVFKTVRRAGGSNQAAKNYYEGLHRAHGGPVPGYATGGHVQALQAGGYVQGPGTATSDSIRGLFSGGVANVSNREYVIQARAVRKYGVDLFDRLNAMQVPRATSAATPATRPAVTNNTYNIYPQRADFTVHDLEALQQRADTRARVGRPR